MNTAVNLRKEKCLTKHLGQGETLAAILLATRVQGLSEWSGRAAKVSRIGLSRLTLKAEKGYHESTISRHVRNLCGLDLLHTLPTADRDPKATSVTGIMRKENIYIPKGRPAKFLESSRAVEDIASRLPAAEIISSDNGKFTSVPSLSEGLKLKLYKSVRKSLNYSGKVILWILLKMEKNLEVNSTLTEIANKAKEFKLPRCRKTVATWLRKLERGGLVYFLKINHGKVTLKIPGWVKPKLSAYLGLITQCIKDACTYREGFDPVLSEKIIVNQESCLRKAGIFYHEPAFVDDIESILRRKIQYSKKVGLPIPQGHFEANKRIHDIKIHSFEVDGLRYTVWKLFNLEGNTKVTKKFPSQIQQFSVPSVKSEEEIAYEWYKNNARGLGFKLYPPDVFVQKTKEIRQILFGLDPYLFLTNGGDKIKDWWYKLRENGVFSEYDRLNWGKKFRSYLNEGYPVWLAWTKSRNEFQNDPNVWFNRSKTPAFPTPEEVRPQNRLTAVSDALSPEKVPAGEGRRLSQITRTPSESALQPEYPLPESAKEVQLPERDLSDLPEFPSAEEVQVQPEEEEDIFDKLFKEHYPEQMAAAEAIEKFARSVRPAPKPEPPKPVLDSPRRGTWWEQVSRTNSSILQAALKRYVSNSLDPPDPPDPVALRRQEIEQRRRKLEAQKEELRRRGLL